MENNILLRKFLVCILGSTFLLTGSVHADELSHPERTAAQLFDAWCLEHNLDIKTIYRKATEAQYQVATDRRIPLENGQEFIQKNWVLPSHDGEPFLLATSDITNGSLRVLGCAIYGPKLHGHAMESELSKLPRMGMPTKHPPPRSEGKTLWWAASVGTHAASEDSEVMMSQDVPGMPGVSINLIYKIHMDSQHQGK